MTGGDDRNSSKKAILEYEENNGDYNTRDTSPEVSFIKDKSKYTVDSGKKETKFRKLTVLLVLISLLLFIGIILIIVSRIQLDNCEESRKLKTATCDGVSSQNFTDFCTYSDEAKRVGLGDFLDKVKETYHEVFPEEIAFHPDSSKEMIREKFRVHNPRPENIKRLSDRADALYEEAVSLNPDLSKLKPREHKAYLQAKHFLESTFANPYVNFKSGIWMLGPSSFCSELMCSLGFSIYNSVGSAPPEKKTDVERILGHFKEINQSVYDYIDVLKMGIQKGMVRTRGECIAGLDAIKSRHSNISKNGPEGIKGEWYVERFYRAEFYEKLKKEVNDEYVKEQGVNVSRFIIDNLKEYVGKSVHYLLIYLQTEHYDACRPDHIGPGGLSGLPLDVIYSNETVIPGSKTDPYLPLCYGPDTDCRLNGSKAYARILNYFTTKDVHPLEVHKMGWENVKRIYPQMVEIAKNMTHLNEEKAAVKAFQNILNNFSISYFHDESLPENETNKEAQMRCSSDETAKKYCPKRWAAMMKWFKFAQMAMSMHDPNTIDFFFFTGEHQSTPNCPIKLRADYNPSSGAQSYDGSDYKCTVPCHYNIPFFLEHLGPKYSEYSVNAHEARPGHHTQVQGLVENFGDKCGGPEGWLQDKTYYTAFTEGWALYGENPLIAQGTNVYETNLMQKYGMLKWQMWRALRLIVDTGLHYKGYSRKKALELFEKYAWDNTDLSKKEVTRYQSNYGQATAYMIGQLDIWSLRNHTQERLREKFSLKEFHLQTLSQGSSPLAFLKSHITKYIDCKLNISQQYCHIVLNPTKQSQRVNKPRKTRNIELDIKWPTKRHYI